MCFSILSETHQKTRGYLFSGGIEEDQCHEMGWESFNIELFILLLIEVTEESLHNWKAFYKIKLLIFNFPHLILMAKLSPKMLPRPVSKR